MAEQLIPASFLPSARFLSTISGRALAREKKLRDTPNSEQFTRFQ
jgi:hypothetical protein